MHVVLGIPHLWVRIAYHHPVPSQSLLESDYSGAADGTCCFLLESNHSGAVVGRLEVTQASNPPEPGSCNLTRVDSCSGDQGGRRPIVLPLGQRPLWSAKHRAIPDP